jgi:hypothetical protein
MKIERREKTLKKHVKCTFETIRPDCRGGRVRGREIFGKRLGCANEIK